MFQSFLLSLCALALLLCGAGGVHTRPNPPRAGRRALRVMTYNIHVGVGMAKQLDLKRIAGVIRRARPDLVGLQEVDSGVERTRRVDQIAGLGRLTGVE